ncbi:MAG: SDR family oxidoreductase [Candidatus Firestonebacteria bacterium]
MKSLKNIFITGSTGFLGMNILRYILQDDNIYVYLLIRGNSEAEVKKRGWEIINKIYSKGDSNDRIVKRVNFIKGDVSQFNLGLNKKTREELFNYVDSIYHCAALTGFRVSLNEISKANVEGTKNILEFAIKCKKMKRFNYISTAFIVGNKNCTFTEKDFDVGQKFNNTYEQTKFEAERLVRKYNKNGLRVSIFRPSIIVGKYLTGETTNFKMFYEPLHFFSQELFKEVPVDLEVEHNLVPIDAVAEAVCILAEKEEKEGTYHIISTDNIKCHHFMDLSAIFFGYNNPKWVPLDKSIMRKFTPIQKKILIPFIPYFNYKAKFSSKETETILRKYNFKYPPINDSFINRLFEFCNKVGFIKKKKPKSLIN